jgi:putative flavoprotein involved in K+ transport
MALHGHLVDITARALHFADDLAPSLDAADAVYNGINAAIDGWIAQNNLDVTEPASRYLPAWTPTGGASTVSVSELAAVVWATGFHSDYRWLHVGVFDGAGQPQHLRGVTDVDGLYFIGLPWLHTWGSGRFAGIARDAEYLAAQLRSGSRRRSGLATSIG